MMFEEANFHLRVHFAGSNNDGSSGGYGTTNYEQLSNKPSINGHTLIGNLTSSDHDIGGGGSITIDSSMSATSTNPVQNRAITAEINTVRNLIPSVDSSMSTTSTNPVQNRAITAEINTVRNLIPSVDSAISDTSTNPVQNKIISSALNNLRSLIPTIDSALSSTSQNPVENRVIVEALAEVGDSLYDYAVEQGYEGTHEEFNSELYAMMLEFDRLIKYEDFDIIDTTLYMYRGDIIGTTIYI